MNDYVLVSLCQTNSISEQKFPGDLVTLLLRLEEAFPETLCLIWEMAMGSTSNHPLTECLTNKLAIRSYLYYSFILFTPLSVISVCNLVWQGAFVIFNI